MASAVRERLKAEGAIGFENYPVSAKSPNSYRKNGRSVVTREERSKTTGQSA